MDGAGSFRRLGAGRVALRAAAEAPGAHRRPRVPRGAGRTGGGSRQAWLLPARRVAVPARGTVGARGAAGGVRGTYGRGGRRAWLAPGRRKPGARPHGSVLLDGEEVRPLRQVV